MNKPDSLKCISYLSDVIGLLSGKWERPHTDIEVAILKQLHDVQETIRKAYVAEQPPISPEAAAAVVQYFEDMTSGLCPICHQPVQEEKQVGRCVYALPCWHRMYQGTAKPKPEKIHPYFQEQSEQEKRERP